MPRNASDGSRRTIEALPGARAGALPRCAIPQLATLVTGPPPGEGWLHEVKFDGYRILARVDDLPGLIGLVQMGIVEIHTWNSRVDQLEQPNRIVLDLDPDPAVSGADLIAGTRLVRDALAAAGLESFVKTTGGKGYHVVVPLVPGAGWEECAGFARRLAETLAAREPARFVATMARAARRGKIFIDYLRNARGATSVTDAGVSGGPRVDPRCLGGARAAADARAVHGRHLAAPTRHSARGPLGCLQPRPPAAPTRVGGRPLTGGREGTWAPPAGRRLGGGAGATCAVSGAHAAGAGGQ